MSTNANRDKFILIIKKYLPLFSLILLTVSLLIYFGFEQLDKSTKPSTNNLLSDLYSKTLKPLFNDEQFTKEDVLNFALYNNLTVNKEENKILQISDDHSGSEVIEVKKAGIKENIDNYSEFIAKMDLNRDQLEELDSLLESFRKNIINTIFSDDNKTLAIDSRIGLLHRILKTEIFDFIARVKDKNDFLHTHTESTLKKFNHIIEDEKNKFVRNYIFITPDTVLQFDAKFTQANTQKIFKKNSAESNTGIKVIQKNDKTNSRISTIETGLTYKTDSNFVKVFLSENYLKELEIEKFNELNAILDSNLNRFNISIGLSSEDEMNFRINASKQDSNHEFHFEFNLSDLGEILNNSIKIPSNPRFEDWAEFGIKMDSLSLKFQELHLDTLKHFEHINP